MIFRIEPKGARSWRSQKSAASLHPNVDWLSRKNLPFTNLPSLPPTSSAPHKQILVKNPNNYVLQCFSKLWLYFVCYVLPPVRCEPRCYFYPPLTCKAFCIVLYCIVHFEYLLFCSFFWLLVIAYREFLSGLAYSLVVTHHNISSFNVMMFFNALFWAKY